MTQKGNALVGALKLASIQCDEVTAEAISGTLERKKTEDGEVFHFAGTSGAWALTAPETTGSEATLKGAFAADGWALDAGFDHAVFMAEGKMQGAVVRLDQRGKQPLALALTSDAFTWGDWTLTGQRLKGRFREMPPPARDGRVGGEGRDDGHGLQRSWGLERRRLIAGQCNRRLLWRELRGTSL